MYRLSGLVTHDGLGCVVLGRELGAVSFANTIGALGYVFGNKIVMFKGMGVIGGEHKVGAGDKRYAGF